MPRTAFMTCRVPTLLAATLTLAVPVLAQPVFNNGVEVAGAVRQDLSHPLRDAPGDLGQESPGPKNERPLRVVPNYGSALAQVDTAVQTTAGPLAGTTNGLNIPGVGQGDYGFAVQYAPPDTNGAVGATQYVQWVNVSLAVFDKTTGQIAPGFPKAGNAVWAGFGGG